MCYVESSSPNKKIKCSKCNTKLTIMNSITCKCNQTLCYKHRYFNEHDCTFDYKSHERNIISIDNPKISIDKVIQI